MISIDRSFQTAVHQLARNKGFYDSEKVQNVGEKIALMHSELSELLEAYRNGTERHQCNKPVQIGDGSMGRKLTNAEEELADLVIRAFDFAEWQGIDLITAMVAKHQYNLHRSYKHGKGF